MSEIVEEKKSRSSRRRCAILFARIPMGAEHLRSKTVPFLGKVGAVAGDESLTFVVSRGARDGQSGRGKVRRGDIRRGSD